MTLPRPRAPLFPLIAMTALAAYLALVYEVALVMLLFCFLMSLFVIGLAVALIGAPSLVARREHPAEVLAGEPFEVGVTIVNASAIRSAMFVDVEDRIDAEPARGHVVALGPAEHASFSYRTSLPRRGEHRPSSMGLSSRFPFGLFERKWSALATSTIVVLPRPGRLRRDVLAEVSALQADVPVAVRGGMGEFHGVREFRSGDNPRWIHWKTSARRRALLVREFEREVERRVLVVLDAAGPDGDGFERGVTLAATLLDHYVRRGYRVALGVTGAKPAWVPFGAGADHVRAALRPLALARSGATTPAWPAAQIRGAHAVRISTGTPDEPLAARLSSVAASFVSIAPEADLVEEAAHV